MKTYGDVEWEVVEVVDVHDGGREVALSGWAWCDEGGGHIELDGTAWEPRPYEGKWENIVIEESRFVANEREEW